MEIIEAKKIPMLEQQQNIQDSPKWNLDHKEAQELNLGNQYASSQDLITVGEMTMNKSLLLVDQLVRF